MIFFCKQKTAYESESRDCGSDVCSSDLIRYENLAAGLSGGVIATMVLHPLDLVKIRFAGKLGRRWQQH